MYSVLSLQEIIALSAVQSFPRLLIHNTIFFIKNLNNAWYKRSLANCAAYLSMIASNVFSDWASTLFV